MMAASVHLSGFIAQFGQYQLFGRQPIVQIVAIELAPIEVSLVGLFGNPPLKGFPIQGGG
jgi:hypothetical protein